VFGEMGSPTLFRLLALQAARVDTQAPRRVSKIVSSPAVAKRHSWRDRLWVPAHRQRRRFTNDTREVILHVQFFDQCGQQGGRPLEAACPLGDELQRVSV